jgi:UDP-GlcNAc:undecaprenyl-phosphate GlcNAc-1-phosphate transferase
MHILFGLCLFVLSCFICWVMIKRVRIMDIPNERSSHDVPVPKSGGIAIVAAFVVGLLALWFFADKTLFVEKFFPGFVCASLFVAAVSFYDDLYDCSPSIRLASQAVAAIVVMMLGLTISQVNMPWVGPVRLGLWGYGITFIWIVGLTNAYNFMDGINGLAGGTAVIACLFFSIICFTLGSNDTYLITYALAAGTLGFLVFNFPKGRLFMGNVGSMFLGFVFATLAIVAALHDPSHTSLFVMPLLLLHFIYDTFFTFIRRLIKGENVFAAHRSHLYQLFNRLGYSHTTVSVFYFAMGIAQGFGAWKISGIPGDNRAWVFVPYLIFQIIYSIVITRKAKKANLI